MADTSQKNARAEPSEIAQDKETDAPPLARLFIRGLSSQTTKKSFEAYFAKYDGTVRDIVLKLSGNTYGFLTIEEAAARTILEDAPHVIDGATVTTERANAKPAAKPAPTAAELNVTEETVPIAGTRKIFLGGIASCTQQEHLKVRDSGTTLNIPIATSLRASLVCFMRLSAVAPRRCASILRTKSAVGRS
jgi:hypothetical protein